MTTVEITQIFQIAHSALSDRENNPKHKNLLTLLCIMSIEEAEGYLSSQKVPPKFSPKTRFIKLTKSWLTMRSLVVTPGSFSDRICLPLNTESRGYTTLIRLF